MRNGLFIGIDGGATRCRARIADAQGRVLGTAGLKAAANISSARQPASVMRAILRAARIAARDAGIAEDAWKRASAGFGLAGGDITRASNALKRIFKEEGYFRAVEIRTDAHITWLGAFGGGDGAILILGTGSCGLAVVDGKEISVSGYGPVVSDEASGQRLGRTAIRQALWAHDGRSARTALAEAILARFHHSPEEIVTYAKSAAPADFGEIAPLVFEYAANDDTMALSLVGEAAADAGTMIRRLLDAGAPSVYLHGGLAKQLAPWIEPAIRKRLLPVMNDENIPLDGAVLLAQRKARKRGK